MDITITGRNTVVSEALKTATREKLSKLDRFARGHGRIEVEYIEQRNPRIHDRHEVEVLVHLKGHLVKGHAAAADHFAALDLVVDKVEHQVRKLKERRVDRSHPRHGRLPTPYPTETAFASFTAEEEEAAGPPRVVKVKPVAITLMSTEEAALQMDLLSHDFFFFVHGESGRPAVIYRRNDGDLGLLEAVD